MLPWGRRNVPVGMTVSLEGTTTGSPVKVHTYDRLGLVFGRQHQFNPQRGMPQKDGGPHRTDPQGSQPRCLTDVVQTERGNSAKAHSFCCLSVLKPNLERHYAIVMPSQRTAGVPGHVEAALKFAR